MSVVSEATQRALEQAHAELPPDLLATPDFDIVVDDRIPRGQPVALPSPASFLAQDIPITRETIDPTDFAQQVIDAQRARYAAEDRERDFYGAPYYSPYGDRDWYCYCSPSRGGFFREQGLAQVRRDFQRALADDMRVMAMSPNPIFEPVTYQRWDPPEVTARLMEPSTELAVVPKPEPHVITLEMIPEPKRSRLPKVGLAGVLALTAAAFVFDLVVAALHY